MDKTININLGGTLFQVDEEAYKILRDYLNALNSRFRGVQGAAETIEDIELRISEIFQSQRGLAGVITKENVEAMIAILGKPEDFEAESEEGTTPQYQQVRKRMYRNPDDSIISGVCGGLGAYLNTDPVIFRILFVLSALCFGTGFLIYLVLWIALPTANTEGRKREMYGNAYNAAISREKMSGGTSPIGNTAYSSSYQSRSGLSNAFNEIFGAVGRVAFIVLRIFLIVVGVFFVVSGFLFLLSYVMVFIFKYPGAFSTDAFDVNIAYFPDFLNYIVNPSVAPWIIALATIAVILPMLALIYWGVKMIFWFRAKDGLISLIAFVVWVMAAAALSIILFNEGISFAEAGKKVSSESLERVPSTLYIKTGKTVDNLKYDKDIAIEEEGYTVYIDESQGELYITPYLRISDSGSEASSINITRRSSGRSDNEAMKRAEELAYSYSIQGDTIFLDEYFTIPSGRKWSADFIGVFLYLPEGTRLVFDAKTENLLHEMHRRGNDWDFENHENSRAGSWIVTEDGIEASKGITTDR